MKHLFFAFLCAVVLFSACEPPAPQLEQEQLIGLWQFKEGTIDGNSANEMLNELYFEFSPTQVTSNLLPQLATGFSDKEPYTIDGMSIIVKFNGSCISVFTSEDHELWWLCW